MFKTVVLLPLTSVVNVGGPGVTWSIWLLELSLSKNMVCLVGTGLKIIWGGACVPLLVIEGRFSRIGDNGSLVFEMI